MTTACSVRRQEKLTPLNSKTAAAVRPRIRVLQREDEAAIKSLALVLRTT